MAGTSTDKAESDRGKRAAFDPRTGAVSGAGAGIANPDADEDYDQDTGVGPGGTGTGKGADPENGA
jgi:hypothetical protein